MITVSFGKGKFGHPGDPLCYEELDEFAEAIRSHARVKKFDLGIDSDEYQRLKDRGPWVMRGIDEATAYDAKDGHWHRRIGSVTDVDWLMFDGDKMPFGSYARTRRHLLDSGHAFIMYKSTGHNLEIKDEKEAFRVFLPCLTCAGPIAQAVSAFLRNEWLPEFDGGEWDPAGDEPTRIMYLPFVDGKVEAVEGEPVDCVAIFEDNALTLVKKSSHGLEREEKAAALESFGAYTGFAEWCLDNIEDAVLIKKPDGRIALQMPGQQPDKYSGGDDGGDGWNFYSPSGGYDMLVFHSLHALTEPEGTFKVQDAVNVLARHYGNEPARHYASGARGAMAASNEKTGTPSTKSETLRIIDEARESMFASTRQASSLPDCGAPPAGSEFLKPSAFNDHQPVEWPDDIAWDKPQPPDHPGEDASEDRMLKYEEEMQVFSESVDEWDRQYEANRIERHKFFNDSFVLVANKSRIANLNQHPGATPLSLRDWQVQQLPKVYFAWEGNKVKMHQFSDAWLRSEGRREVFDVSYQPGEGRVFFRQADALLNRFYMEPFEYTEDEDLLKDFFWLVDRTHPIAKEADLFLDWLAFTFRYPHKRVLWAYTNISEARGSGRGTLKRVIENLIGPHNVKATDVNMVDRDQYHDYAHECRVTIIEEADEKAGGGRVKISGHWNEAITADRRMLNLKYGSNGSSDLFNNMVFFLNKPSIIIDPEDRRINATTGAPAGITPISKEKAAAINELFNSEAFRDQLASFVWRRDLTDFDYSRSDPTLPARARLLAQSTSVNEEAVDDLLDKLPSWVVPQSKIHQLANSLVENSKILKPEAVIRILQDRVILKKAVTSKDNGSHKCYFFEDPDGQPRGWSAAEMDKFFKSFMK